MMGRVDLYIKLAQRVAAERSDVPRRLDAAARAGNLDEIAGLVHSTKSIFGALGAVRLQRACVEVEKELRQGRFTESAVTDLSAALSTLTAELGRATESARQRADA